MEQGELFPLSVTHRMNVQPLGLREENSSSGMQVCWHTRMVSRQCGTEVRPVVRGSLGNRFNER